MLEHRVCRFATADARGQPHVAPVWYVYDGESFYIITNYKTKKYRNLLENKRVSLVIDDYPRKGDIEGVCILGTAEILERGERYRHAQSLIQEKYENWNKYQPWSEGKVPIIRIISYKTTSW